MNTAQQLLPRGHFVDLPNGHHMHYLDYRSTAGGKDDHVVVFLHGSGLGASGYSNFRRNYECMLAAGYRVIMIDHLGYGFSDKPQDVAYTLDLFVECTRQTLEHIGVQHCTFVGNSLGGAIALGYALKFPQAVDGLILMAPGGVEQQADYFKMEGQVAMKSAFVSGEPITPEKFKQVLKRELVYVQDVITDELIAERLQVQKLQNSQVMTSMIVPCMEAEFGNIQCPVLVFWGTEERMMPLGGAFKLAQGCPNCRVILASKCGHWVMLEYPDLFNRMNLDFLANDCYSRRA